MNFSFLGIGTNVTIFQAVAEFVNKVYKKKKLPGDPFLGKTDARKTNWKVYDMGNIVLHILMKEIREIYDIETLWTVGEQYDDFTQRPDVDPVLDIMEKHIKYLQELQPAQ